jgi:hypothetical protein
MYTYMYIILGKYTHTGSARQHPIMEGLCRILQNIYDVHVVPNSPYILALKIDETTG